MDDLKGKIRRRNSKEDALDRILLRLASEEAMNRSQDKCAQ